MEMGKLEIDSVMSVTPLKMTEPRRVRKVMVGEGNIKKKKNNYGGCYQVVLYYQRLKEDDNEDYCGWKMAGWIVESLGMALSDYPLLAGRLHRKNQNHREMEIVSNDSGVRMVEATISTNLSHFLQSSQKHDLEPHLVFWKDIDEDNPHFSPLFYLQMTNFQCGGYSIGISCSLLVADVLVVENFINKWAHIHKNLILQNGHTKTPIFYHPRLKYSESLPTNIITRTPYKNGGQTMLFNISSAQHDDFFNFRSRDILAMLCVEEAEKKLDIKMGSCFSFFVKEDSECEVVKLEFCSKPECKEYDREVMKVKTTTWDDLGVYEVAFEQGNRPLHVSRWIGSDSDDGNVVVVPNSKEGVVSVVIIVTPPTPTP